MNIKKHNRRNFLIRTIPAIFISAFSVPFLAQATKRDKSEHGNYPADLEKLSGLISDKKNPLRWVFTGDSITQGAKHTLGLRAYPEIFAERMRFEKNRSRDIIINTAISGNTSQDILKDFDWRITQFCPDVVSIMVGTNDAALVKKTTPDAFKKNLTALIHRSRKLGAIPILHTPNIIIVESESGGQRKDIDKYITVIQEVARVNHVILVDHWLYWQTFKEKVFAEQWLNDPLHPNGKGHLEMARLLFRTLSICDDKSFTCTGQVACS